MGDPRILRRAAASVPALALVAALCACGGPSDGAREDRAQIRDLLTRQASAVTAGERDGYLRAVDPAARDYRAAQRRVFQNLRRLPLAAWSVRVGEVDVDGRRAVAEVRLRYRLSGYDRSPVGATEKLLLIRRDDGWRITGERRGSPRQLWEQGRVEVRRGARSLVLSVDADTGAERAMLREIAAAAERAVPAVSLAWPRPWAGRVVVEVPGTLDGMGDLLGSPAESYQGIAAVTLGEGGGAQQAPADRIVVNPEAYRLLSRTGRQVVMTHETVHVAARAHTTDATPLWLSEGLADWFGYRGSGRSPREAAPELARAVHEGDLPDALPRDRDFRFGRGADALGRAYESGWLACRMIAREWGEERLMAFYLAVGRQQDEPRQDEPRQDEGQQDEGQGSGAVEKALREVLGVSGAEFTARWRGALQKELGT